jgi:hypothetical protein
VSLSYFIYSISETSGLPGNELLLNTYVVRKRNVKGKNAIIDLEQENLWVNDKSIFVSIQAQVPSVIRGSFNGNIKLPVSYTVADTLTFIRGFFTSDSHWSPILETNLERKDPKLINTLFTVEVEEYR